MNRRGFLGMLAAAPAVAGFSVPDHKPGQMLQACASCTKPVEMSGAQVGLTILCGDCSKGVTLVDLKQVERECGKIDPTLTCGGMVEKPSGMKFVQTGQIDENGRASGYYQRENA